MAFFRALEDARPREHRLFADPFARSFLDGSLAAVARAARFPFVAAAVTAFVDRRWPGARTSAVARTRFIDEALRSALRDGTEQVVLLGAGFDARAYRLDGIERCRVFEVDHPATLAKKREVVARSGVRSGHVTFVPTDFHDRGIEEVMAAATFDRAKQTFVLWEGVTNYLDEGAVDATLRWCASVAPSSVVLFTYVHAAVLRDPRAFHGTEVLFATLSAAGEKWTFGLDPADAPRFVAARGLLLERDLGAAEYRALCYGAAAGRMRGYEFYHIAVCRVAPVARG
jgi:methyltransferase (TIGR00027 family)